jgi:hypothetical protein
MMAVDRGTTQTSDFEKFSLFFRRELRSTLLL